ncbi:MULTISPECIES: glycosyltransferase family 4 protein [Metallosphaera]|uniref:Glycosyl transferase, group 1 n=3 Tax=Metallosphaera TaxID=41980 RepID=A4YHT0_METS5|nr:MULTISPECIES: glycosyltransferase family 4 protein [Metallosphaera]ABP95982.1 glycosyl transferase, group 1 [Metallosphaera sedula DSM 5348]AIM27966.1 glycosyl transferase, group 1 [Metallosphaera sedula]AKV74799.1 glycosyl transferase family 1 [Metallosphaera sedula]AKV77035.1 glycosyl transferase family 1 [Metallosphaera sedula]AKV79287.1 glycosyl transferase family 1 [Metallosphaera sedula]
MKVLISAYEKMSSGIASYTEEVAKLLSSYVDLAVLSFDDWKSERFKVIKFTRKGVSRALPYLSFLRNKESLEKIEKEFDVIHETLPPWGSTGNNLITTKWGYIGYFKLALIRLAGLSFPEKLGAFPVTLQHYIMDKISFRKAKYIVSMNDESANFIPPPIENRTLKKYEYDSKLKLLFVSRDLTMKRKNLKVILNSFKYLKKDIELHLVGEDKGKIRRDKNIIIHGFLEREKVFELMYKVDALILPSTYEELGYVGLEAYSIGLPLITSKIPSFNTIFKASPKFDPYNPKELGDILNKLSCGDLEEIGRKGYELVKQYNEIARKKFLGLYKEAMNSN